MRFQYEGILCSAYIFLHLKRMEQQVIPDRAVQWSTPWVVFLWRRSKIPLVCGFFPSLRMITVKNQQLFAPPANTNTTTMARQHTQLPLTFVNSLTPRTLAFHEIPTLRDILVQKGCFSNSSPCFSGVNFSNNISIPQV